VGCQYEEQDCRIQVSYSARRTLAIELIMHYRASNSSHCEWSPCGRYILTATLSPRLRVDNDVKIWWCGGQLLHIHPQEELYQASFKPVKLSAVQPFPAVAPKAPEPNESVALYRPKGETSNGGELFGLLVDLELTRACSRGQACGSLPTPWSPWHSRIGRVQARWRLRPFVRHLYPNAHVQGRQAGTAIRPGTIDSRGASS
jgi:uncharacterized protein with WD repeat